MENHFPLSKEEDRIDRKWRLMRFSSLLSLPGWFACYIVVGLILYRESVNTHLEIGAVVLLLLLTGFIGTCSSFFSSLSDKAKVRLNLSYNFVYLGLCVCWSSVVVLEFAHLSIEGQALLAVVNSGIAAGTVLLTLNSSRLAKISLLVVMPPALYASFQVNTPFGQTLAYLGSLYTVILLGMAFFIHELLKREFELTWENKQLLEDVKMNTQAMIHHSKMISLGEMAGGIAHEINNPMTIILGYTAGIKRALEKETQFPKLIEKINRIEKTCHRIVKIVQSLRRVSHSANPEEMKDQNLMISLQDSISICEERLRQNEIQMDIQEGLDEIEVPHNSVQISQVFLNLIGNAIDAIQDNEERWIRVSYEAQGETFKILFTDSGAGIPVDQGKKLFAPFFTTKDVGKGTGLGLSISSSIMKSHSGYIEVDFSCKNTQFVLSFPNFSLESDRKSA